MPRRKTVSTLLKLSETFASKIVLEFLRRHSPSTCKYCTSTSVVNEYCHDLVTLKEELSGLPACIRISIYKKVKSASRSILAINPFEYFYFETLLFEDKDLRIHYQSNGESKDEQFFSRFGWNVNQFTCNLSKVNTVLLLKNVISSANLQSVEFYNLTESILEVIGSCCPVIRSITGRLISHSNTYNSAFRKLVFKDPITQLQRNNCCHTLERFDVKVDVSDSSVFVDQIGILIHNAPNLKYIGHQPKLEHIIKILKPENQTPLKLQSIWCIDLTLEMIETVKTYFPDLDDFGLFSQQPLNIFQALNTISSIRRLSLVAAMSVSDLYDGILYSEWRNLSCLFLHGQMGILDLSTIARKLPRLEILGITRCAGVTWDGKSRFNNLEVAMIEGNADETNYSGIRSFSKTVEWLTLHLPFSVNTPVIPDLLDGIFPKLISLKVSSSSAYNLETVKVVLKNCPELQSFSCLLGSQSVDEYRQISTYLKENNIDCIVE